jgi:hypothetical protein
MNYPNGIRYRYREGQVEIPAACQFVGVRPTEKIYARLLAA